MIFRGQVLIKNLINTMLIYRWPIAGDHIWGDRCDKGDPSITVIQYCRRTNKCGWWRREALNLDGFGARKENRSHRMAQRLHWFPVRDCQLYLYMPMLRWCKSVQICKCIRFTKAAYFLVVWCLGHCKDVRKLRQSILILFWLRKTGKHTKSKCNDTNLKELYP